MLKPAANQAEITKVYRSAGLSAPVGKGEHTMAFHRLSAQVAKQYVAKGYSEKEALRIGHATAMRQLGASKAVQPSHRRHKLYKRKHA
jgi:hypothetical protein